MRLARGSAKLRQTFLVFASLCLLLAATSAGQLQRQSAGDLIKRLTYQSNRTDKHGTIGGKWFSFDCGSWLGEARDNRAIATLLAGLGSPAIPDLETAFDSIEKQGQPSPFATNAQWLLLAYAKIAGPAALPRFRRMISAPKLAFLQNDLDLAATLSLGLTSYVSGSREIVKTGHLCNRGEEPRDALNQFILAWERDDRASFEASLGPDAQTALQSLLVGRAWADMRVELWGGKSTFATALGYRFEVGGRWSRPEETLDDTDDKSLQPRSEAPELGALFKNAYGTDCGRQTIRFSRTGNPIAPSVLSSYAVNNSDLGTLLRFISYCAANTAPRP